MQLIQKKTVYFVRHGQSVDNASPVFQALNSPLSEKGIEQARNLAEQFSTMSFEALISSPVPRAKETAGYISEKTHKDIVFSDLFVERVKPEEIDGKPHTDVEANNMWRAWEESLVTPGKRVSNGENYDDIVARVDKALRFLEERPETTMAVVTHSYFLRSIVARVLLGDHLTGPIMKYFRSRASVENTALTILSFSDAFEEDFAWHLVTLNDRSNFVK